jgi:hypothetical protein
MCSKTMAAAVLAGLLPFGSAADASGGRETAELPRPRVIASLRTEGIRFVAPNSVYQMRLEVFDANESKIYDSGSRFGNVLDWSSSDAAASSFGDGRFVCLVSVRDVSGQLAKRWGVIDREGGAARWLAPVAAGAGAGELELPVVTGVEDGLIASRTGAGLATALLAHDGISGLLASGSGGLSFRLGDYLEAEDVERMRLTEQGNLGIGVENPRARLDVAGVIQTSEGIRFPDGTLQTTAAADSERTGGAKRLTPVAAGLVDGSGTPGVLAKWTTSMNIGDSTIAEVGGNVGIGTTSPAGAFDLQRASSGDLLQRFWNSGAGGAKLRYVAGNGATSQVQFFDLDETVAAIAVDDLNGFRFQLTEPRTNDETVLSNSTKLHLTRDGTLFARGTVVAPNVLLSGHVNLQGSMIYRLVTPPSLVSGLGFKYVDSTVPWMAITGDGNVGIGVENPTVTLDVAGRTGDAVVRIARRSGSLLFGDGFASISSLGDRNLELRAARHWFDGGDVTPTGDATQSLGSSSHRWSSVWAANGTIQTSDARLKREVAGFRYGLREVLQLRPVTFEWKDRPEDRPHLGLIAQEVQRVIPETVVAGSDPAAMLGMTYTDLVPVLIKAIQEQQGSIAALTAANAALMARVAALERSASEQAVVTRR